MAYELYEGLHDPDEIIDKIHEFAISKGWTAPQAPIDDLDIINHQTSDGKKCCLLSPNGKTFINLRSANGYQIFKRQRLGIDFNQWFTMPEHLDQDGNYVPTMPTRSMDMYGVGITASSAYSANSEFWFDQADVPKYKTSDNTGAEIGVGLTMIKDARCSLYLNAIEGDNPCIVASLFYGFIDQDSGVFQHVCFGDLVKVGNWNGGTVLSGTANSYSMFLPFTWQSSDVQQLSLQIEMNMIPLFSTTTRASTFIRIDMDDAPSRGYIIWASSGGTGGADDQCFTGKQLAMPLRVVGDTGAWIPKVPHYGNLQSQTNADQGRNSNTLNCVTVDLSIMACVIRDPDSLRVFSPVGYIPGIYFISTFNVAMATTYEINYPNSGELHQAFPMSRRGGKFGYDGLGVEQ